MELFTEKTASSEFFQGSIKPQTLRKWRHFQRGPAVTRLHGKVFYTRESLESFVTENTIEVKPRKRARG